MPATPKSEFRIADEPVRPKQLLYSRNNPIYENVTYSEVINKTCNPDHCVRNAHMELTKKSGDIHTIVSFYPSSHNLPVYLVKTDGHIRIAMDASMMETFCIVIFLPASKVEDFLAKRLIYP